VPSGTPHDTATNSACQVTEHGGQRLLFYQVQTLFQSFVFYKLPSYRHLESERITLKTLVLDSEAV
jgi:hypothetical protein